MGGNLTINVTLTMIIIIRYQHCHLHHHGHQVGKLVAFLSSFVRDNAVEPEVISASL